ncbi:MAG TPA: hypothetical protein VKA30_11410 [Actinomycetota bacterium]|nr:hypothetical protein [Actinomycetota bacterium]
MTARERRPLRGRVKARRATWPRWGRILTAKWVVIPVTVVTVLALAFVSYGFATRLAPTKFSRGGPVFRAGTVTPGPSTTRTKANGGSTVRRGTPDPPRATKTKAGSKGTGAAAGPATAGSALAQPAVGVYRITMSGTESVRFGPLSICNRRLPTATQLSVEHAQGESVTSYAFDLPISGDHTERHLYRYDGNRLYLDFEGARVTCAGVAQTSEISFSPPELRVVAPLKVGAEWSGASGDADRTEHYRATVLQTETLSVAGRSVPTFVIETRIDLTGSESGHRLQRWWYAPSLGMPVRWYEEISASRSGATYSERATFAVASL